MELVHDIKNKRGKNNRSQKMQKRLKGIVKKYITNMRNDEGWHFPSGIKAMMSNLTISVDIAIRKNKNQQKNVEE